MQTRALAPIVVAVGCAGAPASVAPPPSAPSAAPHMTDVTDPGASEAAPPPGLFVHVDVPADPKRRLGAEDQERLRAIVREAIAEASYATEWPGGLPSASDLAANGARAFIVAATIDHIAIKRAGARAAIDCSVLVRIAPWYGIDGGEQWETATAAMARGRARATTSPRHERVGIRDCVLEVGQEVTTKQILPFLARLETRGE